MPRTISRQRIVRPAKKAAHQTEEELSNTPHRQEQDNTERPAFQDGRPITASLTAGNIGYLQHTVGNKAVQRLLSQSKPAHATVQRLYTDANIEGNIATAPADKKLKVIHAKILLGLQNYQVATTSPYTKLNAKPMVSILFQALELIRNDALEYSAKASTMKTEKTTPLSKNISELATSALPVEQAAVAKAGENPHLYIKLNNGAPNWGQVLGLTGASVALKAQTKEDTTDQTTGLTKSLAGVGFARSNTGKTKAAFNYVKQVGAGWLNTVFSTVSGVPSLNLPPLDASFDPLKHPTLAADYVSFLGYYDTLLAAVTGTPLPIELQLLMNDSVKTIALAGGDAALQKSSVGGTLILRMLGPHLAISGQNAKNQTLSKLSIMIQLQGTGALGGSKNNWMDASIKNKLTTSAGAYDGWVDSVITAGQAVKDTAADDKAEEALAATVQANLGQGMNARLNNRARRGAVIGQVG